MISYTKFVVLCAVLAITANLVLLFGFGLDLGIYTSFVQLMFMTGVILGRAGLVKDDE